MTNAEIAPESDATGDHHPEQIITTPTHNFDGIVDATSSSSKERVMVRVISAGFSFFVAGVNDGSLGSLLPYLLRSYHIETNVVIIVYGTTFAGWVFAALSNNLLCQYLNFGALLGLGASLQVLAHVLRVWRPPFPLYAVTFFLASLGQAFQDTHANTFVSSVPGSHRWLGFIHAMYMAGCLVAPFAATAVASHAVPSPWSYFYFFPFGLGVVNLILVLFAFRESLTGSLMSSPDTQGSKSKAAMKTLRQTVTKGRVWILSAFYLFYLGTAITAGGWVVEYLVNVRKGDLNKMGYVPAGFYGGGFLGRLLLAEPTFRLGERRMVFLYILLCVGLELVFWLVPNVIAGSVAISLFGFFSGPLFASGISVGSKLFTPDIYSSAIAMVFVVGQIGGSIFPALTGILANHDGVQVLQPILVGLLAATGVTWLLLPKPQAVHTD